MPPPDDAKSRVRDWFTRHAAAYTADASQRAGADLVRVLELLAPVPPAARALAAGDEAAIAAVCGRPARARAPWEDFDA